MKRFMWVRNVPLRDHGRMKRKPSPSTVSVLVGVAVCSARLAAAAEIQLLPAGAFRARPEDGRPAGLPAWRIDAGIAAAVIAAAEARATPFVIDYEHQTLRAEKNGQPAPAAGWFKRLEWREPSVDATGQPVAGGLYATDVEWTEAARAMIEAGEYRYLSPVFSYDAKTGAVKTMVMAALTNYPAIDGMDDVVIAAASSLLVPSTQEENPMEELLEQLRWLLNLPVGCTAEECMAHLQKLIDQLRGGQAQAAASFNLAEHLRAKDEEIAALRAATPDPAQYVPVATMRALQDQVAALTARLNGSDLDRTVKEALAAGKLLPAQEQWARSLGAKDMAALTAYLETAQPIAALRGTQTGGADPAGGTQPGALSAEELAVCKSLGLSAEEYAKGRQAA